MFLQNLRTQTASCHTALERNPYSKALLSPQVTLKDYSVYLQKLYGFVQGFEQKVYPLLLPFDAAIDKRLKTHLLQSDLSLLNCNIKNIPLVPEEIFKVHYTTTAAALGGLYVLEGSVMGGIIIKKHLQQNLGETINDKMKYFTAYGVTTGTVWKSFLYMLCDAATSSGIEVEIINSAVQTFKLIDNWITSATINNFEHEHQEPGK